MYEKKTLQKSSDESFLGVENTPSLTYMIKGCYIMDGSGYAELKNIVSNTDSDCCNSDYTTGSERDVSSKEFVLSRGKKGCKDLWKDEHGKSRGQWQFVRL